MRICLFIVTLVLATFFLTNCGLFDRSAHAAPNAQNQLDPGSISKYLRTRADLIEQQQKLFAPLNSLVSDMIVECKSKHLGDAIQLDVNGLPACTTMPKPPVAPVQPKADAK